LGAKIEQALRGEAKRSQLLEVWRFEGARPLASQFGACLRHLRCLGSRGCQGPGRIDRRLALPVPKEVVLRGDQRGVLLEFFDRRGQLEGASHAFEVALEPTKID